MQVTKMFHLSKLETVDEAFANLSERLAHRYAYLASLCGS